jgi:hypothetical protein
VPGLYPAPRYLPFTVTTAASVTQAAPVTQSLALGDVILEDIELLIPDGPSGLCGIAFTYDGFPIVPWGLPVGYIIGNNDRLTFEVQSYVGHPIVAQTYNTDIFAHSLYVRCKVRDLPPRPEWQSPYGVVVPVH